MVANITCKRLGWGKWLILAGGVFLGWLQIRIYFVRELFVAELLLLLAFGLMGLLCGVCLLLGIAGARGGLLIKEGSKAAIRVASASEPIAPKRNQRAIS